MNRKIPKEIINKSINKPDVPSLRLVGSSTKFYHNKNLKHLIYPGLDGSFRGHTNKNTLTNLVKRYVVIVAWGERWAGLGNVSEWMILNSQIPA